MFIYIYINVGLKVWPHDKGKRFHVVYRMSCTVYIECPKHWILYGMKIKIDSDFFGVGFNSAK